jgi:hypothetical protein
MRGGGDANHSAASSSNAIMWLVFARTPRPDAPYWPGRRLLALADAAAWPAGWMLLATQLPQPTGIVGPMIIAFAALSAVGRVHRAIWQNQRYHFTTWRWGRVVAALSLLGVVLSLAVVP